MTYKIQIDDKIRDANAKEIAEIEAREAEAVATAQAEADKALARAALLERLSITKAEAALLLG